MMTNKELIIKEAIDVFGSKEKADCWLETYHSVFDTAPIKLLDTVEGVAEVMQVLGAIKYGGVV
jgi:uncharacterized protein (DUF2384 family)